MSVASRCGNGEEATRAALARLLVPCEAGAFATAAVGGVEDGERDGVEEAKKRKERTGSARTQRPSWLAMVSWILAAFSAR